MSSDLSDSEIGAIREQAEQLSRKITCGKWRGGFAIGEWVFACEFAPLPLCSSCRHLADQIEAALTNFWHLGRAEGARPDGAKLIGTIVYDRVAGTERFERATEGAAEPSAPAPDDFPVCEHGVAMDVHCCGCHRGFLFDSMACTCLNPEPSADADWGAFLRERHLLILEWSAEGQTPEQIARALSMDPVQVQLISMTPEASTRVHARKKPEPSAPAEPEERRS